MLSAEEKVENQPDRPDSIQLQISKLTASNTHVEDNFTLHDLKEILKQYSNCDLIRQTEFPNNENQLSAIPKSLQDFADSRLNPYLNKYAYNLVRGKLPDGYAELDYGTEGSLKILQTNTLKKDQRCDIWTLCVDQVWLEFLDTPTSRTRPVPFVESIPLTLWVCQPSLIPDSVVSPSDSEVFESSKTEYANENGNCSKRDARPSKIRLKEFYSTSSEGSIETDSKSCDSEQADVKCQEELQGADNCDKTSEEGNVQYAAGQVANFNVVARIGGKLRAQLNHFQYLFLMRLLESVTNFQTQMNADLEQYLKSGSTPETTFSIPLVIPEIEFAMVCPYIAELLPLTQPADLGSPVSDDLEQRRGSRDTDSDIVTSTEGQGHMYETYGKEAYTEERLAVNGTEDQYLTVTQTANGLFSIPYTIFFFFYNIFNL